MTKTVFPNILSGCGRPGCHYRHPSIYIAEIGEYHAAEFCDPLDELQAADDTATRPTNACEECGKVHRTGGGGRTGFSDCGEDENRHQNDWNY